MISSAILDTVRTLFVMIDLIIYSLIATVYNLIENVTHYRLFEDASFLTDKIYVILSIFMLFKVSFSFVNYLINPDSLTDKEKGIQHVVKNIVIMFAMLVMAPWAFNQLWGLQDAIISEGVLERFVFGEQDDALLNEFYMWDICEEEDSKPSVAATNGDYIALMSLRAFYRPYSYADIGHNVTKSDWKKAINNDFDICKNSIKATPAQYLNPKVVTATIDDGEWNLLWFGDENIYLMNYMLIVSTAVGVVVLLILIGFAMDVGLRLVKLSFLQLIAPIPIVSFIEPSSSKNGMFTKWLKEVGATWASVFIRLFALFFAVRVIQEVSSSDGLTKLNEAYPDANGWVILIVIIGALMFAKQLPKLITDLTGIKMDGGFNLNPLKKIENEALGGRQLLGAGAAGVAAGMAGAANLGTRLVDKNTWKDKNGNRNIARGLGKTFGSTIAGATSAGARTFSKVSKDGKVFSGIKEGHLESMFAKQQRDDLERKGSTFGGRLAADAHRWVGSLNAGQRQELLAAEQDQFVASETEKLRNEKLQLSNREAQLGNDKANLNREKADATRPFEEYSTIIGKIKKEIEVDPKVKAAQAHLDYVKETNSADMSRITAAQEELDKITGQMILNPNSVELKERFEAAQTNLANVTAQVEQEKINIETAQKYVNDLKRSTYERYTTEGDDRYELMKTYTEQLDKLREENEVLATDKFDYIKSDGAFNEIVMYAADRQKTLVEESYSAREEQIRVSEEQIAVSKQDMADREREIENYKKSDEYVNAHDQNSKAMADNAARKITGKQPEGWKPSADVNAGGTRGYGGNQWYNNNGGDA